MGYYNKSGRFDRFFKIRNLNIDRLENEELSKKEFLEENYLLIERSNISPFLRIDNFEMGFYNYLYYNVLAKYYEMKASEAKNLNRHKNYKRYINNRENYYNEKDKATLDILEFLNYENIELYFIKSDSSFLNGKLFEIVLKDYERAILHSKSEKILKILKSNGIILKEPRESIINSYINTKY